MTKLSRRIIGFTLITALLGAAVSVLAQETIPYVESVGDPLRSQYPTNVFARNIWDMEVFDGRLYFGSGNSDNDTTGGNAGPVTIRSYDAATDQFAEEYLIYEEQIERFIIIGDRLFVPGHDPYNAFETPGRLYTRTIGGEWGLWDTLPPSLHVYDVHYFEGSYYAALGADNTMGGVIARSTDDGATWEVEHLPGTLMGEQTVYLNRAWSLFDFNGTLYISTDPLPQPFNSFDTSKTAIFALMDILSTGHALFVQPNVNFLTAEIQEMQLRLANDNIYTLRADPYLLRIERPVHFNDHLVYLSVVSSSDHNWTPINLYTMDTTNTARAVQFEENEFAWDLWVEGGALYVLLNQQVTPNLWRIRVMSTCDLENWGEVLAFNSAALARSFARYDGDFYFGLGTQASPLLDVSGSILRVRAENAVVMGCAG